MDIIEKCYQYYILFNRAQVGIMVRFILIRYKSFGGHRAQDCYKRRRQCLRLVRRRIAWARNLSKILKDLLLSILWLHIKRLIYIWRRQFLAFSFLRRQMEYSLQLSTSLLPIQQRSRPPFTLGIFSLYIPQHL